MSSSTSLELEQIQSGFDELRTAERTFNVELNGALPLSDLRDDQQTSGYATITDNESEYRLNHTTAGDFVRLASSRRGSYQPGTVMEGGIGIRLDTNSISGDGKGVWGLFDMDETNTENIKNGMVFGLDKDGLFVEVIKDSTSKEKVYESNFNRAEDSNIDLTDGNIFQIKFLYYGYGVISFQRVKQSGTGFQEVETLHETRLKGETSVLNPNMKIGALAKSSSTTGDFSIYVGGRQISVQGKQFKRTRINSGRVEGKSIGSSFEPILSFRKKQGFREINTEVFGLSVLSDQDIVVQVRLDATITGGTNPSFGSLDEQSDSETSFELDTSATQIDTSTGVKIYETLVSGGSKNKDAEHGNVTGVPTEVADEGTVTFAAKHLGSAATIDFLGQMTERF